MKHNSIGKSLTMILQVSITMLVPIALCVLLAIFLDDKLDTIWFMPPLLFLGIGAAFRNAWILVKDYTRRDTSDEARENLYIEKLKEQGARKREMMKTSEKDKVTTR